MLVRALVEAVETTGIGVDRFLREASIEHRLLSSPNGWVEVAEFDRLAALAVELTADPAFGLHWGERSPLSRFDWLASTPHAPTLREGLSLLLRLQNLVSERPELEMIVRAQSVFLRIMPLATTDLSRRVRVELGAAGLVRWMRLAGAAAALRGIAFAYPAPSYLSEYARLFDDRTRFNQDDSEMEIDPVWLDRPLRHVNADLHRTLTAQAQQVLERVQSAAGYAGQVRNHLFQVLPRLPGIREVSRALALSERSLRRRLTEEGCSYAGILRESRLRHARQLLADPTRTIQEVAFDTGFATPEAFHHAFKRWTGRSPQGFRSTLHEETCAQPSDVALGAKRWCPP